MAKKLIDLVEPDTIIRNCRKKALSYMDDPVLFTLYTEWVHKGEFIYKIDFISKKSYDD